MLTKVIKEKNTIQDANVRLDVELKDVRAQLADSVKENKSVGVKTSGSRVGGPELCV